MQEGTIHDDRKQHTIGQPVGKKVTSIALAQLLSTDAYFKLLEDFGGVAAADSLLLYSVCAGDL